MQILRIFGLGSRKLFAANHTTTGTVTDVTACHWLKVNQKALRTTPLDGAAFPHMIRFTYQINGNTYHGSRFIHWNLPCPSRGEALPIYFDPQNPAKYAVSIP